MTTTTPATHPAAGTPADGAPDWVALHIHYTSNPNPLLAGCISPLVRELHAQGQIDQHFFIRYWLEGPHVRLRLRPAPGVDPDALADRVRARCEEFFAVRPAVYEVDPEQVADMYRSMYLSEYTQEQWDASYGVDGTMPVRPNNSVHRAEYEPEHARYGGPVGMAISEWHFEESSRATADLVARVNMHLRTVTFGLSTQMMVVLGAVLVPDRDRFLQFLEGYEEYWARLYVSSDVDWSARYDEAMERIDPRVPARLRAVHAQTVGADPLPVQFLDRWRDHCLELRERITRATLAGQITFGTHPDGTPVVVTDPDATLRVFLGSYLHMHNNRMGVTPNDESYLAHVLRRCLVLGDGDRG
jgi:hypothetical protein